MVQRTTVTTATMAVIGLGAFVTTLDNTIVAAGAPSIARDLGLSLATLQWVSIGYMLPFAGLLPVAGTLVDRWGQGRTLAAGLVAFGAGAVVGGLAASAWLLIAARVLQGAAAAFLVPGLLSLLRTNLDARGRAIGAALWTACLAVALALGPVFGGLLSEYLGWSWIFFVNLPFVLGMLVLLPATVTTGRDPAAARPPMGSMALVIRQRQFLVALAVQLLWGLGVSGVFFFTPLLHQESLGLDPVRAGLPLAVVALAVVAATPLVPAALATLGPHRTVGAGLAVVAVGLLAVAVVNHLPEVLPRVPGLVLIGAGSAFTTPLTSHALEVVPERHAGTASGLLTASRELSSALGVALIGAVLSAVRTARLDDGLAAGPSLAGGYTAGLLVAAGLELAGAALAVRMFRGGPEGTPSPDDKRGIPFSSSG